MNYQSLVISIILSGTLGFLNYNLLVNQGTLSSYSSKEDRSAWCISFSIMNYLIYILVASTVNFSTVWNTVITVVVTVAISVLITSVLLARSFWLVEKILNRVRNDKKLSILSSETPHETAFENNSPMQVYIFDFSRKFIISGYVVKYSESLDLEHQLLLDPQRDMPTSLSEEEVIELMNKQYLTPDKKVKDTKIYVNTKSQLKYYIIYLSA
ncbi:hypothetical protein [Lactiplantibacillus plantarum]|uniref:hypothetical protein n=1 Tax=Lactiplantibacillus plantarum TaxID=1590 RepID=UPI0040350EB5